MELKLYVLYEDDNEAEVLYALRQLDLKEGWLITYIGVAESKPAPYFNLTGTPVFPKSKIAKYWVLVRDTEGEDSESN